MALEGSSATIKLTAPGFRKDALRSALVAALVLFGLVLPYPPLIAENAYPKPKVPGWAADAYWIILAVSIIALIWAFARPRHMGVRFDDRGVRVCNYFRTCRFGWDQVSYFADGYAACLDLNNSVVRRGWALSVVLHDGRGITATGTMAPSGSPEMVMAVRRAAECRQVVAKLTGVAADRRRAWLDDAVEIRRHAVRYAVWLAATAVALAGTVVLVVWGATHQGNYYLAVLVGVVLLGCLLMTRWVRKERARFLGRRLISVRDQYGEGDWFAVPQSEGFAPGLIARTEPSKGGVLLCYFFAPLGTAVPTLGQLRELRAGDALLVQRLDGLAPDWPRLGRAEGWDRGAWPVPAFGRSVRETGRAFLDIYDDDLRFLGEETTSPAELDGLPPSELLTPTRAAADLADLLRKPSGSVSVKRGDRMTCVECGAETGAARRCRRCGAPAPERPRTEAPDEHPVNQKAAQRYLALLGWTVGVLLNIVALWIAIVFVVIAISEGSPAQEGPNYVPLWACAFMAIVCSIVPAFSVVILVQRRRGRRAIASDSPELLPEGLD